MICLSIFQTTLPLENPVLKFLTILVIILLAPLLLNRFKVPPLLGLIIAGAVIGPFGFNLIERDSGIILSGTAGLLYIMFLAGLEMDLLDFQKNRSKSVVFGLLTFSIPMFIGLLTGLYVLQFSLLTSVLLASMFASHTLIAYPLVSKLGVSKNRAVVITVGGTIITDTLALIVLAVVVGMTQGQVTAEFWLRLLISLLLFGATILFLFPIISRWFFKRFEDSVSQYVFVLVMVFLGAELAELAGIEPIIGAFLTGLALNRLIPRSSPLMNRVEFVGNAIFIPFFLIGVGMLINYRVFFTDWDTIIVAAVMTIVAAISKFLAALFTQKIYGFTKDERRLIFGLSNAQAAATLAAVLVGYNIIMGTGADGEPIRLLNDNVLNGTILMILVTCTMASFAAQKGATNIALSENVDSSHNTNEGRERVLIPISNIETAESLVNLGITVKSRENTRGLFALNIIDNSVSDQQAERNATRILKVATDTAAATDNHLQEIIRYDQNIANAISSVVKEQKITDVILGLHAREQITDSFLGNLTTGILDRCLTTTLIYKPIQPLSTIKRHIVLVPEKAEREPGFPFWLVKVWNISRNTGAKLVFYATAETIAFIDNIKQSHPVNCDFMELDNWEDLTILQQKKDDNLIIVLSRKDYTSFNPEMTGIPEFLNQHYNGNSFILIYPLQVPRSTDMGIDLRNPSMIEPFEKLDEMGKTIAKIFKRR